jgi:hypothetical protein
VIRGCLNKDLSRKTQKGHLGENIVKILLITSLVLMLTSLALAVHEEHQLAPYTVSFDMNTSLKYQIHTQEQPIETPTATVYPLVIETNNSTNAVIFINAFKNLTDSTLSVNKNLIGLSWINKGINVTSIEDRVIDGKKGFLASGMLATNISDIPAGLKFYRASYWLDDKNCACGSVTVGKTNVDITSSYPQNVTENLLESIHIVIGHAPAKGPAKA